MLLSGTDNHLTGMGTNAEVISEEQRGKPGYEGYLNDGVMSVSETLAMQGKPILACWKDEKNSIRAVIDHLAWELLGWRTVRRGDWKATWLSPPFGQSKWQLFNLRSDPGEVKDLSLENPDMVQTLIRLYEDYVERCGVLESLREIDL